MGGCMITICIGMFYVCTCMLLDTELDAPELS